MASSELRQPQQGAEQATDLTSDPFQQDRSAWNPATFGTVVTKSHHLYFVPRTNKYNLHYYAISHYIQKHFCISSDIHLKKKTTFIPASYNTKYEKASLLFH
jgi:hypothetical protein